MIIDGKKYFSEEEVSAMELVKVPAGDESNPFMEVGKSYFIRTVTHYFTGELVWVGDKEIAMTKVCWIADTGRFNVFAAGNGINESEPFPSEKVVIIGRGSIIDMSEHSLISTLK